MRPTADEILRVVGATLSDRAAPQFSDDAESTHLVGRETHLLALKDAFEAAREGRSVAVRISGRSGLGKSAVAHRFLDELEQRSDVLVLRGRAYERESIPYKAVDGVIDELTRHLMALKEVEGALDIPRGIWALAHVFPVLRRVQSIDEVPPAAVGDPQIVRLNAFGVLRELFASLARRKRVVVFIDDVQWGDTDSVALLVELMRQPGPPSLLLVTTHRVEEEDTSSFLRGAPPHPRSQARHRGRARKGVRREPRRSVLPKWRLG